MRPVCKVHIAVSLVAIALIGIIMYPLGGTHPSVFGSVTGWLVMPFTIGLLTAFIVGRCQTACIISIVGTGIVLSGTVVAFLSAEFAGPMAARSVLCASIPLVGLVLSFASSTASFIVWGWWISRQNRIRGIG